MLPTITSPVWMPNQQVDPARLQFPEPRLRGHRHELCPVVVVEQDAREEPGQIDLKSDVTAILVEGAKRRRVRLDADAEQTACPDVVER
jgi:hypothetical protein